MPLSSSFSRLSVLAAAGLLGAASSASATALPSSHLYERQSVSALPTPGMGFNTYNAYACSPSESTSHTSIDHLQSDGYLAAGYNFFQVDCGWVSRNAQRDSSGNLETNTDRFPSGMSALSQYATSKGFSFGLYSDAGYRACDTQSPSPVMGSLGYEAQDAALLQSYNVSYLKYDNCYADGTSGNDNAPKNPRTDFPTRFGKMSSALANVGIKKLLVCQWGVAQKQSDGRLIGPSQWTQGLSTSFRLADDIASGWINVQRILNQAIPIALNKTSGPGHFADGDLLEVGNSGMTIDEQATHFAYWAMVKSPLVISTDLTAISSAAKAILLNKGLIAVNQDSLGEPVKLIERRSYNYDLHAGKLANGDMAVLAFDWTNTQRTINVQFGDLGVVSADVTDLWSGATQTGVSTYSKQVNGHGSIALRLSNIKYTSTAAPTLTYINADKGVLAGAAVVQSCSGCSDGHDVGFVGNGAGNTLTINNIPATSSEKLLYFDYVNADVGFSFVGATNDRVAQISVNGGSAQNVSFPLSGYDWGRDVAKGYRVRLTGFNSGTTNSITISNPNAYAPDFDRIGYVA
ncbi:Glycoside hydrolase, clan GH-D [Kalmanozyma brasiliensis GHG001]|uniref:Alpha-galactosidase n=1 Tax=Kalmanozyma brasiliensis (strain GHG001) TaxID=1365824 RepID=V5GRK3_KALBG|nr:Glycoside hydrolase, clan GH-D [Kalmanozyma brasiliensis GHG001]EST08537.1 Glycoside hydrolase, clan GH-D [Kalmanozyma brasiliensis GHG001]